MQVFGRQDFQYLYDNCFSEHDRGKDGFARFLQITDEGVFLDACLPVALLRWKPVHELAGPNKPPSSGPALPFPFTASQLAAFMLWGWGNYFQDAFGRLDCGPNEFVLNGDHEDAADAYEALRQAYVIYQDALRVVGNFDHEQQRHADELNTQYYDEHDRAIEHEKVMEHDIPRSEYRLRRRRARAPIASLKVQAENAKLQADTAFTTWRRAMVRQLLPPATAPIPMRVMNADNTDASTVQRDEFNKRLSENLDRLNDQAYQFMDKQIEELLTEKVKALARRTEWRNADPRGIPSEIERKEAALDVATREHEAIDIQIKVMRGDYGTPQNADTQPQETTPSAATVMAADASGGVEQTLAF